ncbi:hypothetical protein [Oryza sativa Japonica Group]|uniref:Uncharacterized protein P0041E11.17 n=1 Tax=Oryza sativa subsp. japonica TaxID=39947 RepID=Q5ZEL3_ORYSJ|nr:hypothetical protein [Oryza sativa Japonica Group]
MVEAHRSARRCELRRWNWTGEQRTRWTSGWRTRRRRWRGAAATLAAARGGRSGGDGGGGWAHGARAIGSSGADGKRGKKVERGAVVGYIEVGRPDVAGSGGSAATTWRGGGGERGGEDSNRIPPSRARARAGRCGERAATWACGTGGVGAGNGETGGVGGGFGGGRLGERRREVEEGADRWAPPVGDPEGFGRREEPAWAGPAEGRPAREVNGLGRRPKKKEKGGKRKDKKEKGFSQGFNIALCLF